MQCLHLICDSFIKSRAMRRQMHFSLTLLRTALRTAKTTATFPTPTYVKNIFTIYAPTYALFLFPMTQ